MVSIPHFVIATAASGQDKTTTATGVIAALTIHGMAAQGFKVGPDFTDPDYHAPASGRVGRNLDPFLVGERRVTPLLAHGARGAEVSVIKGVMGLFDGQLGTHGSRSTTHVATLVGAPIMLYLDASHISCSVAAVALGLTQYDPALNFVGVIINKVASPRHREEVPSALERVGLPILGVLPRDAVIEVPSRRLSLVPVGEWTGANATMERLASQVNTHIDLDALIAAARSAPELDVTAWNPVAEVTPPNGRQSMVAITGGRASTFRYSETVELLEATGCRMQVFDPTVDDRLPGNTAGICLGGGFPEIHVAVLASRTDLRREIADFVASGRPVVTECAGILCPSGSVDATGMVDAIPGVTAMGSRLTPGYRRATTTRDSLYARTGEEITGYELHRTTTQFPPGSEPGWEWETPDSPRTNGWTRGDVHASYLHVRWVGHSQLAQRFTEAVHSHRPDPVVDAGIVSCSVAPLGDFNLNHHGDAELADDIEDLTVSVRLTSPPQWLLTELGAVELVSCPRTGEAIGVLAAWHRTGPDCVLPIVGMTGAFTFVTRGLRYRHPAVIHPRLTEPKAALRASGMAPQRVLSWPEGGFWLGVARVPEAADLIFVGNPTNPTGALYPADQIRQLIRPGRVVVVDEVFMDAVPEELQSLLGDDLTGMLVLRLLTRTWGLAELRVGYVIDDSTLIAVLRRIQTPWVVSSPALTAIRVACSDKTRSETQRWQEELRDGRDALTVDLRALGLHVADSDAPSLLVRGPAGLREKLRACGLGVRRDGTSPGLDSEWFRVHVPEPGLRARLIDALGKETEWAVVSFSLVPVRETRT